ncbi:MAG: response regulator transcription factor [Chthoniobacteraceae bacterium]
MSLKPIRILLADDHEMVRHGVRMLLEKQQGMVVCGEAKNGREAVSMARELKPDIAILDYEMPELNGLEATRQIKRSVPETEILIFTGHEDEKLVHEVFDAGARSYLVKTGANQHILDAVEALSNHKPFFTSEISQIVFARYLHGAPGKDKSSQGPLTEREREIIQLLAEGKSNKEVGTLLGISIKTCETHRAAIMRKLHLDTFSDLVRYAIRNNIIQA